MHFEGDNMRLRNYLTAGAGTMLLLVITGCSGGDGIAALDREAAPEDHLPSYASSEHIDVASGRRVAQKDDVSYFISKMHEGPGFCIIRVKGQDDTAWGAACGGGTGQVVTHRTTDIPGSATLVTDGYPTQDLEQDGWIKITDNILIQ